MTYALHADTFYLPNGPVRGGYLLVEDGKFGIHTQDKPDCEIVELGSASVAPGFVDTHIHGYVNHDVMDCNWDGVNEASVALLANGVTSWLPTTLTATTEQLEKACAMIGENADRNDGARIQGIFLEGPFFTLKHKGAQNPAYLCAPDIEKLHVWQKAAHGLVKKIAIAPEYENAAEFTAQATSEGVVVALGHSDATCAQAVDAVDAGAQVFVHTYNGMSGLHHREPGMVGAALSTPESYAELICDGHHVNPVAASIVMNAKGYDHTVLITDCMCAGGMPDGDYMLGELPVVVANGTARLKEGDSLAGSILKLDQAVRNVIDWKIATPAQAIEMATASAARANNIDDACGFIKPNRMADFVVLSPDFEVLATYLGGEKVYSA